MSSNIASTKHSLSGSSGGGGGVKKFKATASDSSSAWACNKYGFAEIVQRLRSVLHHPIGLPLTCLLENKSESKVNELLLPNFSHQLEMELKSDAFDDLFSECYSSWTETENPGEPALTAALSTRMGEAMKASNLEALHQYRVPSPPGTSKIDVLVRRVAHDKSSSTAPVLLIEVGLQNEDWWKTVDKGITYVRGLTKVNDGDEEKEDKARFTEPMLFTVVTIETKNRELMSARLGVFLCTQEDPTSPSGDFRVALLWRTETSDLQELSKAYARMLRATCLLPKWKDTDCETYEYLGPNCCRIGDKVLRAYDNRMCIAERRPDIYLATILGLTEDMETVCEFHDAPLSSLMSFDSQEDDSDTWVWLWEFRGKLLIISTPFYRGRHWARTPEEFLPIVEQLNTLHSNDYVHGDIRCYNIIFQDNEHGHLIDFDFGGKNNGETTKYPTGYHGALCDGMRPGMAGRPVTKRDDWFSLSAVIFFCHDFTPPEYSSRVTFEQLCKMGRLKQEFAAKGAPTAEELLQRERQRLQGGRLKQEFAEKEVPTAEEIQELVDFLKEIGGKRWTVKPASFFRRQLEEYGYFINSLGGTQAGD